MVTVSHISKAYGKKSILKDLSFEAKSGTCVAIVGRNGCGKSTLLKILAGIEKPDQGEVSFFRETSIRKRRTYFGYVPQENPLITDLSVADNLKLWGNMKSDAARELRDFFSLDEYLHMPVNQISGGMKRRLSMVCALLNQPPVLLLDEPTTALDLYYKSHIQSFFQTYLKKNGTIIMTTHDETEMMQADHVVLMQDGMIENLYDHPDRMNEIKNKIGY